MASGEIEHVIRNCKLCGSAFTFQNTRGRARSYCSDKCRAVVSMTSFRDRRQSRPPCIAPECTQPQKSAKHKLCTKHEARMRRGGSLDRRYMPPTRAHDPRGYVRAKRPGHPLGDARGWAYEHRFVAYDKYGPGNHPCHWCGDDVSWDLNVIDHLDEDKGNNSPDNLVVACNSCNRARGAMVPFIRGLRPDVVNQFIETIAMMRGQRMGGRF